MLGQISANALIRSVIVLMAASVVALLAAGVWGSWRQLDTAARMTAVVEASGHSFKAMHNLRYDRTLTTRGVNGAGLVEADQKTQIRGAREAEMSAARSAIGLLATIEFPDRQSLLADLVRVADKLTALQAETWTAFDQPKASRRAQLGTEYWAEASALIEVLDKVSSRLTTTVKLNDAFVDQMMQIKQLAWMVRQAGGEASVTVSNSMAAGQRPAADALAKYAGFVGQGQAAWTALEETANGMVLPRRLTDAIVAARQSFFAPDYVQTRDRLLKAQIDGTPPGMTVNQWATMSIGRLSSLMPVAEGALETAHAHAVAQYVQAQRRLALQVSLLVLALVVAVGSMALVSRRVIRPLHEIKDAMVKVAAGDLSVDVSFAGRQDEIGALASALGTFKGNAEEKARIEAEQRVRHAQASARQEAVEGHIRAFEGQMRTALEALGGASGQMRATSDGLSQTAEQTNRQVRVVATASEEASSNVQTVASASEQLASSIAEISQSVAKAASIAGRAVEEARETDVTIQGLTEAAGKIGEVVKLINNIAGQTNLLALNATIEAARAGEAGKGFAVVASEVKSLANQTAKATEDISAQIAAVQNVTRETVDAIKRIGGTIGEVSQVATSIASAVEEQGAATQEITRSTQQAARLTKDVLANVSGVTPGADATGSAAQGVKSAAEGLGRQAEQLRHQVDDFLAKIRAA